MQTPVEGFLSVSQLNQYLRMKLDSDLLLQDVWVRGEISNFSAPGSGHFYFTLKDTEAQVRCVMFRFQASKLRFRPESGMKVLLHGKVSVYPEGGQYQIYADEIQPDGAGALALQFEQLKKKLEGEGLFDPNRKRPLPPMPQKIGVITSPTGAAVQDIKNILGRRFPLAEMILFPAQVQGADASLQLTQGILFFEKACPVDVIIIGRGGGSAEDLWAFNDETLARTISACSIPVISAVGHETDYTICDFVADRRAPTPSAAAELAVPDRIELLSGLQYQRSLLNRLAFNLIEMANGKLNDFKQNRLFKQPQHLFDPALDRIGMLCGRLEKEIELKQERSAAALQRLSGSLEALSPLKVLNRGYAVVTQGGKPVVSSKNLNVGDRMEVKFSDGSLIACVEREIEKDGKENGI